MSLTESVISSVQILASDSPPNAGIECTVEFRGGGCYRFLRSKGADQHGGKFANTGTTPQMCGPINWGPDLSTCPRKIGRVQSC